APVRDGTAWLVGPPSSRLVVSRPAAVPPSMATTASTMTGHSQRRRVGRLRPSGGADGGVAVGGAVSAVGGAVTRVAPRLVAPRSVSSAASPLLTSPAGGVRGSRPGGGSWDEI